MNNLRRNKLSTLYEVLAKAKEILEGVLEDETEHRNSVPEGVHYDEEYEKAEAAVTALDAAVASLEETLDYIEEAKL